MANKLMVQHKFKLNGRYKTADGKTIKIVASEVFNLRCYELDKDGNMVGKMLKIHPESEEAAKLVALD